MKPLVCYQSKASEYLAALFDIKCNVLNRMDQEQDGIWIEAFHSIVKKGVSTEQLPSLLALIHPDFHYKNGVSISDALHPTNNTKFSTNITLIDKCQAHEYTGVECIFNKEPHLRGKCHADHRWPSSLGGPAILDNRLILCKVHNGMKSNDIAHFNWTEVPNWLSDNLNRLFRLKS